MDSFVEFTHQGTFFCDLTAYPLFFLGPSFGLTLCQEEVAQEVAPEWLRRLLVSLTWTFAWLDVGTVLVRTARAEDPSFALLKTCLFQDRKLGPHSPILIRISAAGPQAFR